MNAFLLTFLIVFSILFLLCMVIMIWMMYPVIKAKMLERKMVNNFERLTRSMEQIGRASKAAEASFNEFAKSIREAR